MLDAKNKSYHCKSHAKKHRMININGDFCAIFVRQTKRNNKQTHNASLEEVLSIETEAQYKGRGIPNWT